MAHPLSGRRGDAGDKTDDGFFHMMLHPLRGDFFIRTADFADDHNGFCFWIIVEQAQHIEMFQAIDWIAADADRRGLTQAKRGQLRNGFIRERTGTRDDANPAFLWIWPGMMPILSSSGVITPGQFGPSKRVLRFSRRIRSLTSIISRTGMPSVIQMTKSRSASTASQMADAAPAGGT